MTGLAEKGTVHAEAEEADITVNPDKARHILMIDDDPNMHLICRKILEKNGFVFHSAYNGYEGFECLQEQSIDLILLDYMMPRMDGFEFLKRLKSAPEHKGLSTLPVIMLTVLSETHPQRQMMFEMGLDQYLKKPFGSRELINVIDNVFVTNTLTNARRKEELRRLQKTRAIANENRELRRQIQNEQSIHGIVGTTDKMKRIFERIQKVAQTDASVLITGECGTGKELVARAIHDCSHRAMLPFVPVDCSALPGNLLESELFGHEKGTFTGASSTRKGLMEAAHRGTFFMDEIGEMPIDLQAKMLRVLQERQIRRVGGRELIDVDIRIIAATNRDPAKAVEQGVMRQDLFYRLNVIPIHLPPLRERRDDIPLLVQFFLRKFAEKNRREVQRVDGEVERVLTRYAWPGNIRELQNAVERMVSLSTGDLITVDDLPENIREEQDHSPVLDASHLPLREARARWLERFEKKYLIDLIRSCGGNISEVARRAGVNRMTIYRMLKQHSINLRLDIEEAAA